jgi:hypothetical protein
MPRRGTVVPEDFAEIRKAALMAIAPVRPTDDNTKARKDTLFSARRSRAGQMLPEQFLVYFLLVELLGFRNLGKFEKLAWSVPIDFDGKAYLIEHRKFGIGIFVQDPEIDEPACEEIVKLINQGVKTAKPFFVWLAEEAVNKSKLNVVNESRDLFSRYQYFLKMYKDIHGEADRRSEERIVEQHNGGDGARWTSVSFPAYDLRRQSQWMAQAAIDAFFSWTEHVFIHIAILTGKAKTGSDVAKLAVSSWYKKFSCALDVGNDHTKELCEKLSAIKEQLRNFMAHGAFGKRGEAFHFHSGAGAVPVLLTEERGSYGVTIEGGIAFDESNALKVIEEFIAHLWSGQREPARIYIQESGLPLLLTMASDGTYLSAMRSTDEMEEFVRGLSRQFDDAANMDW